MHGCRRLGCRRVRCSLCTDGAVAGPRPGPGRERVLSRFAVRRHPDEECWFRTVPCVHDAGCAGRGHRGWSPGREPWRRRLHRKRTALASSQAILRSVADRHRRAYRNCWNAYQRSSRVGGVESGRQPDGGDAAPVGNSQGRHRPVEPHLCGTPRKAKTTAAARRLAHHGHHRYLLRREQPAPVNMLYILTAQRESCRTGAPGGTRPRRRASPRRRRATRAARRPSY